MIREDKIFQLFQAEHPFNTEGLEEFVGKFQLKTYPKGSLILQTDTTDRHLRFLDKGIVREFYTFEGKEKNIHFYTHHGFITDFGSFVLRQKTKKNQECLSEVQVRTMSLDVFFAFQEKYPCGKVFIEIIFQRLLACKEQKEFANFVKTAEELYLDILEHQPQWLQLVPQYHIASYLGVTPETLSRIRKRI